MSWGRIIQAINNNIRVPLNVLMDRRFEEMRMEFEEQLTRTVTTLETKTTQIMTSLRRAEFDEPGEYEFTVPEGVYTLYITACGGGGGGGPGTNGGGPVMAGAGGGDAIYKKVYEVEPGQVIHITVGSGGERSEVTSNYQTGKSGGATILTGAVNVTLSGGSGSSVYGAGLAGGPGGGNGGWGAFPGGPGILGTGGLPSSSSSTTQVAGGGGGSLGHGGSGCNGVPEKPRRGAGVGGNTSSQEKDGGAGGDGYVEITW